MANVQGKMADLPNEEEIRLEEIRIVPYEDPLEISKPIIDLNSISLAIKIADNIQKEAHRLWIFRRKHIIQSWLKYINMKNAYNFMGYMITTSNSQTVLEDYKSAVSYECLKHIVSCFLKQAKEFGFSELFQYKKLKKEYRLIVKECGYSPKRKASRKILDETNMFLENLYIEMHKSLR